MNALKIPFVKHIGIEKDEKGYLKLEPLTEVKNHIDTIHASAQFTLAETQSGLYLQELFPNHKGKVIPLLRSSSVKFKAPATSSLWAKASLSLEAKKKFLAQFEKKGRAIVTVDIELRDEENVLTMSGEFGWFVQRV